MVELSPSDPLLRLPACSRLAHSDPTLGSRVSFLTSILTYTPPFASLFWHLLFSTKRESLGFAFKALHDTLSFTNKNLLYGWSTTMVFIPHYHISKEVSLFFLGAEFPLRAPCEYSKEHFVLLLQPQRLLAIPTSMLSILLSCLPPSSSTYTLIFFFSFLRMGPFSPAFVDGTAERQPAE